MGPKKVQLGQSHGYEVMIKMLQLELYELKQT